MSLLIGFLTFIESRNKQKLIDNAPIMYCSEYRDSINFHSIISITDLCFAEEYIDYFSGKSNSLDFNFYRIPNDCEVKIHKEEFDGKLIKVVLVGEYPRNLFKEFWIWHEFVTHKEAP